MSNMSKRVKRSDVEDRLSSLPDDILIHNILSLLPMRESVRTNILSRRWRSLWSCVPRIDLEAADNAVDLLYHNHRRRGMELGGSVSKLFVECGDRVMGAYKGGSATLRQFRVVCPLDTFSSKIESWLEFSLGKGVEVLELDFCRYFRTDSTDPEFPLISPHLFPNLRVLRSLTLGGVYITSASLDHLLRGCESLEILKLHEFTSLTELNITGPVSRLKSIEILGYCHLFKSIMISASTPDLVSLTYLVGSPDLTLHIEHAPRLVDLTIAENARGFDFNLTSHPLFSYLWQLETLHLDIKSWDKAVRWLPHLRDLNRLKHLKLSLGGFYLKELREQRLLGLASVIDAASCVRHLTLDVYHLPMKLNIPEEFGNLQSLQHLRVMEIVGFPGQTVVYELVLHLIKGAASLEKLIFDFRHPLHPECKLEKYGRAKSTIRRWKRVAKELIRPQLPSNAELLLI